MKKYSWLHTSKVPITAFQALTCLIQTYRDDINHQATYENSKALYLSGIQKFADVDVFEQLKDDKALSDYEISFEKKEITGDPVRRYFESHLGFESLVSSIESLELDLLQQQANALLAMNPMKGFQKKDMDETWLLYQKSMDVLPADLAQSSKLYYLYVTVYWSATQYLEKSNIIFSADNCIENNSRRGRKRHSFSLDETQKLGIMRDYMPLPLLDVLNPDFVNGRRYANKFSYVDGAEQAELVFFNGVTPFVGSVSGCLARIVSYLAKLHEKNEFFYANDEKQLKLYFKCIIAFGVCFIGNHSLHEFMSILQLPEVQYNFRDVPGFSSLTLDNLFKIENSSAFKKALEKTIEYNGHIINRKKIHQQLNVSCLPVNTCSVPKLSNLVIQQFQSHSRLNAFEEQIRGDSQVIYAMDNNALPWIVVKEQNQLLQLLIEYGVDMQPQADQLFELAVIKKNRVTLDLLMRAGVHSSKIKRQLDSLSDIPKHIKLLCLMREENLLSAEKFFASNNFVESESEPTSSQFKQKDTNLKLKKDAAKDGLKANGFFPTKINSIIEIVADDAVDNSVSVRTGF